MKYPPKIYAAVLSELLEKMIYGEVAKNFLKVVRKNGDFSKLPKILYDFKKLYNKKHGIKEVKIYMAREEKNVVNQVKEILKLKHEPKVEIRKEMLGGAVVSINDEVVIDGSVKTRISRLF